MKTLAIRLDDELHAQLSVLAQLEGVTITDEIRQAIESHLTIKRDQPDIAAKAQAVLDDIEREALARRDAIATMFGSSTPALATPITKATGRRSGRTPATTDDSTD
jgi:predicted transcriptional regulator